jgi:predicted short-subunit dehydrogenase-like oxidoreductase (DUF2520 family)
MSAKTVAIIGAGRVGGAVGRLLAQAGYVVTAVATRNQETAVMSRSRENAEKARVFIRAGTAMTDAVKAAASADILLITTPDGAIRSVCDSIAAGKGIRKSAVVVHMSGAQTLDLLDTVKDSGAYRAVIHPLQSVPSMELGERNLPGSYFRIDADPEAAQRARELVAALGGIELKMPRWSSDKGSAALYHAGAVVVSNFFVALVDFGIRYYQALGANKEEALKAVLPLIKGTLANIENAGIPEALTGPIMRGDVETVRGHIEAMKVGAPELLTLYRELARHTVMVAQDKKSISPQTAADIQKLMEL